MNVVSVCNVALLLLLHVIRQTDTSSHDLVPGLYENKYTRGLNDIRLNEDHVREKRQTNSFNEDFYVTQCSHDNIEPPDGPSIHVKGRRVTYEASTRLAALLIHKMVRFMPRAVFRALVAANTTVGLFSVNDLPTSVFEEFEEVIQSNCETSCQIRSQRVNGKQQEYDCSRWCTTTEYPGEQQQGYPFAFLWAYGNASLTYVVETNIVCDGYNPGNVRENYLIREFGLTVMTKGLDEMTLTQIKEAYEAASADNKWTNLYNEYDYFMKATSAWFNGVKSIDIGGMACIDGATNTVKCADTFEQRQHIKARDPRLYDILNKVYNDKREYAESFTSICRW